MGGRQKAQHRISYADYISSRAKTRDLDMKAEHCHSPINCSLYHVRPTNQGNFIKIRYYICSNVISRQTGTTVMYTYTLGGGNKSILIAPARAAIVCLLHLPLPNSGGYVFASVNLFVTCQNFQFWQVCSFNRSHLLTNHHRTWPKYVA